MTDRPVRLPATLPRQWFRVLMVGEAPAVVDVHDGDTFRMVLVTESVAGAGIWPWLRLEGCDAFELGHPLGSAAQQWAVNFLMTGTEIVVELGGWSFDRRIARVWVDGVDMALAMISAGHAVSWKKSSSK